MELFFTEKYPCGELLEFRSVNAFRALRAFRRPNGRLAKKGLGGLGESL